MAFCALHCAHQKPRQLCSESNSHNCLRYALISASSRSAHTGLYIVVAFVVLGVFGMTFVDFGKVACWTLLHQLLFLPSCVSLSFVWCVYLLTPDWIKGSSCSRNWSNWRVSRQWYIWTCWPLRIEASAKQSCHIRCNPEWTWTCICWFYPRVCASCGFEHVLHSATTVCTQIG